MSMDIPYPENTYIASYSPKESLNWTPKKPKPVPNKNQEGSLQLFCFVHGESDESFLLQNNGFFEGQNSW